MFGSVLHYSVQTGEGLISGNDGHRYSFTSRDWNGPEVPSQGTRVEFAAADGKAVSVYPVGPASGQRHGNPSAFPAIAAGCSAGCATYFILGLIFSFAVGMGLRAIFSPGSESGVSGTVTLLAALAIGVVVGYLVYRAVRNRRR